MLRPNAHCGEVRKGNFVPVSHCAKSPEGARRSAQYVFGVPARAGRIIHRGGQVEPGQQAVRSGRRSCHAAVLVAVSRGWKSSRDDSPSGRNSTSADSGGGADSRGLDSPRGTQRGNPGNSAVLLGGNWGNTTESGSRCSNWNNSPTNSNNNIGARGVCVHFIFPLCQCYGLAGRPFGYRRWSAGFVLLRQIRFAVR